MVHDHDMARAVLAAYGLAEARLSPLGNGLINQTWLVENGDSDCFVLQRVNAMFPAAINHDIDVLTRHLEAKGLVTCRLLPTNGGRLWVDYEQNIWRLLSRVDGFSHDALASAGQAREAGTVLGRFHRAVSDLDHQFSNPRPGIHDTAHHLRFLEETLKHRTNHPEYAAVARLGRQILDIANSLPALPKVRDRIVHGDPKVNNILFESGSDRALCLVDLDTISRMPLPLELGDAMRSWCNPSGEDYWTGEFSAELFIPSIEGYAEQTREWIFVEEWSSIVPATRIILVELAARFCADALNESYFAWDPEQFSTRSEHNQVRATGQLTEARSLMAQGKELNAIVKAAFEPG
jgi:Ser/Thr protein kinase RdoA (MazF antagonist)